MWQAAAHSLVGLGRQSQGLLPLALAAERYGNQIAVTSEGRRWQAEPVNRVDIDRWNDVDRLVSNVECVFRAAIHLLEQEMARTGPARIPELVQISSFGLVKASRAVMWRRSRRGPRRVQPRH